MTHPTGRDWRSAVGWLAFPLVPALLGTVYHDTLNLSFGAAHGPDPRDWNRWAWVYLLGPLIGYGFLAGATAGLPDPPGRRGWKGWLGWRSIWVGVGPWSGFLVVAAVLAALWALVSLGHWVYPPSREWGVPSLGGWVRPWMGEAFLIGLIGLASFGWLAVAWAAIRRARRGGRAGRALGRGLAVALGFVGSLLGSFWAITAAFRSFFFDPRVLPLLLVFAGPLLLSGCGGTITLGESRRRDLFQAMLTAWLIGLALAWRWWGRPGPRPSVRRNDDLEGQA